MANHFKEKKPPLPLLEKSLHVTAINVTGCIWPAKIVLIGFLIILLRANRFPY